MPTEAQQPSYPVVVHVHVGAENAYGIEEADVQNVNVEKMKMTIQEDIRDSVATIFR